jgi:hypothetical protein
MRAPCNAQAALRLSRGGAAVFVVLLAGASTRPAAAQGWGPPTEVRHGFWIAAGAGHGFTDLACGICNGDRETGGVSGYVRLGGTLTSRVLLGGDVTLWRRGGGIPEHLLLVGASAQYYPSSGHGYYLRLGAGQLLYRARDGDQTLVSRLWAGQAGGGYEMRVHPRVSMAPFAGVLFTPAGDLLRENRANGGYRADRVAADLRVISFQVGIGIIRH